MPNLVIVVMANPVVHHANVITHRLVCVHNLRSDAKVRLQFEP
jgi:hypothetical protein